MLPRLSWQTCCLALHEHKGPAGKTVMQELIHMPCMSMARMLFDHLMQLAHFVVAEPEDVGMLQLQGFMGRPVLYKGLPDCFIQMLRNEGPRSFYRGMVCSYLKVCTMCHRCMSGLHLQSMTSALGS